MFFSLACTAVSVILLLLYSPLVALVSFSGEEGWGKYLDLNIPYGLYLNVKDAEASLMAA